MNILYVVHQFFPEYYTGTERFVLNLCRQMQKMGHCITVLTHNTTKREQTKKAKKLEYINYQFQNIPVISISHQNLPHSFDFNIYHPEMESFYEMIFEENNFEIIHIGHPMRNGSILKVAHKRNIPVVLTLTDFWLMCPNIIAVTKTSQLCECCDDGWKCLNTCFYLHWKKAIKNRYKESNDFLLTSQFITSPSKFLAGLFIKNFGCNIQVIKHGVDYSGIIQNKKMIRKNENIVFGHIGTVLPHKGVHIIIQALKLIDHKNIKIKIFGNYLNKKRYYLDLLDMIKGDSRIEFMGEYKDNAMQEIMNSIDCSICASIWWENSPLTILTSLAYRVPVITTNVGGSAEFIHDNVNGFNFSIGDPTSLADVFTKILHNPELLNNVKDNIIRTRRVEEEAFEYEIIYQKLVRKVNMNQNI